MNELEKALKELKKIEPSREYSQHSKLLILSTPKLDRHVFEWKKMLWGIIEYSSALALAAILLLIVAGNTPISSLFSPLNKSSLSASGLRAEAEAVDIQIRLFDISYNESSSTMKQSSSLQVFSPIINDAAKIIQNVTTTDIVTSGSSSVSVSIDEALDILRK